MHRESMIGKILVYLLLIIGTIVCLFPFYWMVRTALVDMGSVFEVVPTFIPKHMRFANFTEALTSQPFGRFFINSLIITVSNIVGVLLTSSLCAYGFTRINWPGR